MGLPLVPSATGVIQNMAPLTITIQIFSDTICPWSYIGKKDLEYAMKVYKEHHPDVHFETTWIPFYLNPKAKVSAYDKKDYFLARSRPADAPALLARVEKEAAAQGLTMNWEGKCGSTRDSHILLLLAAQQQRRQQQRFRPPPSPSSSSSSSSSATLQDLLAEALFRGALEQGRDISDRSFLAETAAGVGLEVGGGRAGGEGEGEGVALLGWLDSEGARGAADALDAYAKAEVGITAVPSYVVQGRFRVGGKQDPGVFLRLFERIRLARQDGE